MYHFDLSTMRHRTKLSQLRFQDAKSLDFYYTEGSYNPPAPTIDSQLVFRENHDMWDVVVKDFHRRSKNGEIFNNPMYSEHVKVELPLSTLAGVSGEGEKTRRTVKNDFGYAESTIDSMRTLNWDDSGINTSITAAYAGVTANEQNAVLWLGEFRETIKMFKDIGQGLYALWQKTKKQRAEWAKGKLTIPEAQSLTLGILYGIVPLEQSITQVMEGLFNFKPANSRQTSRGFSVTTDVTSDSDSRLLWGRDRVINNWAESLETTVRAGVLYDIDIDDLPRLAIIADPKQIVETAYALARLSFVIDWFINVGNTLKAWSPSTGTNILAAFVSIEETYTIDVQGSYYVEPLPNYSSSIRGERTGKKMVKRKYRYPIDRSDLAILPRVYVNLDLDKIFALVLLFARVKGK